MNPFDSLPDDPLINIFAYIPRCDLLQLSLLNRRFHNIITDTKELKLKLPLRLDFGFPITNDVMEFVRKHHFVAVELVNIDDSMWTRHTLLMDLLITGQSVESLTIISSRIVSESSFRRLINGFIPYLKKCFIGAIHLNNQSGIANVLPATIPLRTLRLVHDHHVRFFTGCVSLTTFQFDKQVGFSSNDVYEFLAQQTRLTSLKFCPQGIDLNRMVIPSVKHLSLDSSVPAVAQLIYFLPRLQTLSINIFNNRSLGAVMEAISSSHSLTTLKIWIRCPTLNNALNPVVNNSVVNLHIRDSFSTAAGWLMQMFNNTQFVGVNLSAGLLRRDQSSFLLSNNLINIIEFEPSNQSIQLYFTPSLLPADVGVFEAAIMMYVRKFAHRITGITIGNVTWLDNNPSYTLHNSFCKALLILLVNVRMVTLYNVENYRELNYFLYQIRRQRLPRRNPQTFVINHNLFDYRRPV